MDSYPFHRSQIPSHPHNCYHPSTNPFPPQMTKSPFPYEQPYPYVTNYHPPHFCYGQNNFHSYLPSYYPHVPHAPFYSGGFPSYGEPFFAPYYSPQSHYSMDVPRNHHCCGCPNHVSNQKEDKTMKIEQEKPLVGMKENDSMIPIQFKNFPYPLVWIPHEYYGNKQMKNPTEVDDKKVTGTENFDSAVKPDVEPRMWNGWLPFEVTGAPNVARDGDGMRSVEKESDNNVKELERGKVDQEHQSEQKRPEFPFPFIWLPYYNNQEEEGRTNNRRSDSAPECVKEARVDEGVANRISSNDIESKDISDSDVIKKVTNKRSIPVKQIEPNHVKNDAKESGKREINVSDDSQSNTKRQSTSSPKRSKLPPVCLRVDPIPRKTNVNGNSRSPSPPASKERSKSISCETSKTPSSGLKDKTHANSNLGIQIAPNATEEATPKVEEIQVQNKSNENTPISSEGGEKEKRLFSDTDAAVLIQAAYRGYLVRKMEPLKKLRQISEIRKEVTNVRDRVQAFESDLQNDDKQKIAIGENIMRLLLKLDIIQGLHPSLREIRKSLARELVTLQEKLDSLAKYPQEKIQEFEAKEPVEVNPLNIQNEELNQEQQEDKLASQKDSTEGISDGRNECRLHVEEDTSQDALDSANNLTEKVDAECKMKTSSAKDIPIEADKINKTASKELHVGVIEDIIEDSADEVLNSDMHVMKSEDIPIDVDKPDMTVLEELHVGVIDEDAAVTSEFGKDEETNYICKSELQAEKEVFVEELPVGLVDEDEEESEYNENDRTSFCTNETAKDTQLEQPLVLEKEDELKVNAPMSIEESRTEKDTKMPSIESLEHGNEEACLEGNDSEEKLAEQETKEDAEEKLAEQEAKDYAEEKLAQQETKDDAEENLAQQEAKDDAEENLAQQETKDDADLNGDSKLLEETKDDAEENLAQQETKDDADLNGDSKLLEENEKLRKLMKELLEAGNKQLGVISNLSGRVKDLEKKLAKTRKSKKVKTKRHRSVTPKMACELYTNM